MANTILNKAYGSGSVFGYELDYYKTDVEKSDGITQCDLGYLALNIVLFTFDFYVSF